MLLHFKGYAQERLITGKVVANEDSAPIPGATVQMKHKNTSVSTNEKGEFFIRANKGDILIFKMIGFKQQQVIVADGSVINVALSVDNTNLNEVVVIGYAKIARKDVTGSISSITGDDLRQTQPTTICLSAGYHCTEGVCRLRANPLLILSGLSNWRKRQFYWRKVVKPFLKYAIWWGLVRLIILQKHSRKNTIYSPRNIEHKKEIPVKTDLFCLFLFIWGYSIRGHPFRKTWPHITAQNDQSISLKSGHPALFKRFLASQNRYRPNTYFDHRN